jgi:hypothetical protein
MSYKSKAVQCAAGSDQRFDRSIVVWPGRAKASLRTNPETLSPLFLSPKRSIGLATPPAAPTYQLSKSLSRAADTASQYPYLYLRGGTVLGNATKLIWRKYQHRLQSQHFRICPGHRSAQLSPEWASWRCYSGFYWRRDRDLSRHQ